MNEKKNQYINFIILTMKIIIIISLFVRKIAERSAKFLERVLEVICQNLESKWIEHIDTVVSIFSYDVEYYKRTSTEEITVEVWTLLFYFSYNSLLKRSKY